MVTLTPRLSMVAGLTREGRPLADIGTDHAYLPVYLLQEGRIPHAAASDLRSGPLEHASATVTNNHCSEQVTLLLCNGFDHPELQHYKDFTLAGMGGNLMADLMEAASFLQTPDTHLVLQPQSHAEDVRQFLYEHGFTILREEATSDNGRVYLALEVEYTGEKPVYTLADCHLGKLPECSSPERFDYIRLVLHRLTARHDALLSYSDEREECALLEPVIEAVEAVLATEP